MRSIFALETLSLSIIIESMRRSRLILHPVRLRILQALASGEHTTHALDERLADVPKSSIYRHLRLLVRAGLVDVAQTRRIRGVEERSYRLGASARLSAADVAGLSSDEHLGMFSTYTLSLVQDFAAYLGSRPEPDFAGDRVGYTEVVLHTTDDEFDAMVAAINAAMKPYIDRAPRPTTTPRKLSVITFPVPRPGASPTENEDATDSDDPAPVLAGLTMPTLIAAGTTDIQVSVDDAALLAQARPDAAQCIVEGMNHVLKAATLDPDSQAQAYMDPSLPVVPALVDCVAEFVLNDDE
ncbi:MAG: helix-turn-helix domain-containing protein [Nannocystaceae bacterium]